MSKGNVSLVDGHIDEPSADEFETITDDGTIMGWRSMEEDLIAVGRELTPYIVRIDKCDEVIFRVGEIEVNANFTEDIPLDKIDAIIINGHKFVREKEL